MRNSAREDILDQAVQAASVVGLNGLSIGALAARVNMSKGGICAHFASKEVLQIATVERAAQIFSQSVIEPIFAQAPGLPRLEALLESWTNYCQNEVFEGGCFFTNALFELDDVDDTEVRKVVQTQYNNFVNLVQQLAQEAIDLGQFRKDIDPQLFALELNGLEVAILVWRALDRLPNPIEFGKKAVSQLFDRCKV